jgi:hypothetical protein
MALVVCPGSLGTSAWVVSVCPYLFHTGGRVCCNVLASILVMSCWWCRATLVSPSLHFNFTFNSNSVTDQNDLTQVVLLDQHQQPVFHIFFMLSMILYSPVSVMRSLEVA